MTRRSLFAALACLPGLAKLKPGPPPAEPITAFIKAANSMPLSMPEIRRFDHEFAASSQSFVFKKNCLVMNSAGLSEEDIAWGVAEMNKIPSKLRVFIG